MTLETSAQILLFCLYMMVTVTPIIVVTTILLPCIWGWGGQGLMLLRPASSRGAPDLSVSSLSQVLRLQVCVILPDGHLNSYVLIFITYFILS